MLTQDHEQLDIHIIEKELRDIVKTDPTIKISSPQQTLYNKYQYWPSYFKVWEAKQKAIGRTFGDWDKSYQLLPKWMKAWLIQTWAASFLENITCYYAKLCDIRQSVLGFWSINWRFSTL